MVENLEDRFMRFSDVLGQKRAKEILVKSAKNGRMSHAYLFTGIPGIGKTSTAKAMAAALNCEDRGNGDACGRCIRCRQIKGGNFPDFNLIMPDRETIKIEQIRELQKALRFAPVSGRYRVSVIDQAETMTEEASNAFLKSLEEPPPGNIFILNAVEPLDLLPTIVSRCQRISFAPLALNLIKSELSKRMGMEDKTATVLARISEGSLGKALVMAQSDYLEKREAWLIKLQEVREVSGADALEQGNLLVSEMKMKEIESGKYKIGGLADMLATWSTWYRDLLLIKEGASEHLLINYNFSRELQKEARGYKIEKLCNNLFLIDRAQRDLRLRRNPALVMERLLLSLREQFGN